MQNLFLENRVLDANGNVSKIFNNNMTITIIRYKLKPKFSDGSNMAIWLYIDTARKRLYATTIAGKTIPQTQANELMDCLTYDSKESLKLFKKDYLKNEGNIFNYNFGKHGKTILDIILGNLKILLKKDNIELAQYFSNANKNKAEVEANQQGEGEQKAQETNAMDNTSTVNNPDLEFEKNIKPRAEKTKATYLQVFGILDDNYPKMGWKPEKIEELRKKCEEMDNKPKEPEKPVDYTAGLEGENGFNQKLIQPVREKLNFIINTVVKSRDLNDLNKPDVQTKIKENNPFDRNWKQQDKLINFLKTELKIDDTKIKALEPLLESEIVDSLSFYKEIKNPDVFFEKYLPKV